MPATPLLFLDIDGVLVTMRSYGRPGAFDAEAVANLNRLTKKTGARIVISSTWRHMPNVNDLLRAGGVTGTIIGRTRTDRGASRGEDIAAWLKGFNIEDAPYVILDDDSDMGDLADHLVQTEFHEGLTTAHVERAIAVLTGQGLPRR